MSEARPFVSLAARLLVNVEALNMVEAIGNVTRHRRATVIIHEPDGGYRKVEVPCVSGESLAHAYQVALVEAAKAIYAKEGAAVPVCEWCARGEFFKSMDDSHTMPQVKAAIKGLKGAEQAHAFEREVIRGCFVEDLGGFLRAERPPVKRTSRFQVGYMLPTADTIAATSLDTQFHVRHAPTEAVRGEERAAQMIYYVETGSAIYGLCLNLDVDGIGKTSMVKVEEVVEKAERLRRVRASLAALLALLSTKAFGAKRSRFLPLIEVRSVVAAVSSPVAFTVEPPSYASFIETTRSKAEKFLAAMKKLGIDEEVSLYAFSKEVEVPEGMERADSAEELLDKLASKVLGMLG